MCPHCGQSAIEKCTCMSATTLDEVNFASAAKRDFYIKRHTKRQGGEDGGIWRESETEVDGEVEVEGEKDVDLAPLQAYSSVALDYARELTMSDFGGGARSSGSAQKRFAGPCW
mmetsp:Transcript_20747/g.48698  ORF Transcript_20747/g.48698 Transcript_20747/m.48698 type:complete len:114 (+) Transcript_20747:281-622(+)